MRTAPGPLPFLLSLGLFGGCAEATVDLLAWTPDGSASVFHDAGSIPDAGTVSPPDAGTVSSPDAGAPPPAGAALLLVAGDLGMMLIDVSDPTQPRAYTGDGAGARDDEPLPLYALAVSGAGEIFAGRLGIIEVYRIGPRGLEWSRNLNVPAAPVTPVLDLAVEGDALYAALGPSGVVILDLSDAAAGPVGGIPAERSIHDLAFMRPGKLATYELGDPSIVVYDVSNPRAPRMEYQEITDLIGSQSAGIAGLQGIVAVNVVYGAPAVSVPWFWDFNVRGGIARSFSAPHLAAPNGDQVSLYTESQATFAIFADGEQGAVIGEVGGAAPSRIAGPIFETAIIGEHLYSARGYAGLGVHHLGDAPLRPVPVAEVPLAIEARRILSLTSLVLQP
jgi:hypothetical protein